MIHLIQVIIYIVRKLKKDFKFREEYRWVVHPFHIA